MMIGGNDDVECIFGEGERNVDLSLRERERERVGIFGIPFATCTDRSLPSIISSSSRHEPREKETRKKKKSFDMS